jgi:iron complex outermembrane receptor protein
MAQKHPMGRMRIMYRTIVRKIPAILFLLLLSAAPALAQQGVLLVRVSEAGTGNPLETAQVQIFSGITGGAVGGLTDANGAFRISLDEGTYRVIVESVGYQTVREDGVSIQAGETTTVQLTMEIQVTALEALQISVGRSTAGGKVLEAPASVSVVTQDVVQERVALTPMEHVKTTPGVDVAQTGLQQSNVVTRGFNNVFSGSLLVITDNRYAHIPSLRVNAMNFIPTTDLDLDRIEVMLGPGAALYGPNAAGGVMHMLTTSPIDAPGGRISVAGGFRQGEEVSIPTFAPGKTSKVAPVFQGAFRYGYRGSENWGVKFSGQYFQGEDFGYVDPVEDASREDAIAEGADPDELLIGARDFDASRYAGELRFDYRSSDQTELILTAGANNATSSIELTGQGAGVGKDWRYSFAQARFRSGKFFAQGFVNMSDAGDTYLLRTGNKIVDKSRLYALQGQHGFDVGEVLELVYGIDFQHTAPDTEGTVNGQNEDDDELTEIGGYAHGTVNLGDMFDLVLALRVDDHSALEDLNWSPRAALVFNPTENHSLRATFNRAFSSPSTLNLFLDLQAGSLPIIPGVGYNVQTRGVPTTGYTFAKDCPTGINGYCMYSPFSPGNQLPADASLFWNNFVDLAIQGGQLPATLGPALKCSAALPCDLSSVMRRLNIEDSDNPFPLDQQGPLDVDPIRPTIYNTIEGGYKGIFGTEMKLSLAVDVYYTKAEDFVGPLKVETPSVFLDPNSAITHIQTRLTPLVQGGLLSPEQLAAIIQGLVPVVSAIPTGTIAPDQNPNSDIMLTYRNFGDVDYWGTDLAAELLLNQEFSVRGTYSYVDKDCFDFDDDEKCESGIDVALNAPQTKFSVGGRWNDAVRGMTADIRTRWVSEFPMNSGVYVGTVDSYNVWDVALQYQMRVIPGASLALTGTNIFNSSHREFVGAPYMGSMFMFRIGYDF